MRSEPSAVATAPVADATAGTGAPDFEAATAQALPAARRRIVHVLTRLSRGGTEENTIATCAGQAERGHEVFLVHGAECQSAIRATVPPNVEVIRVESLVHPIDPVADIKAVLALRRLLRRIDPHILHTHQSKGGIVGRLAAPGLANTRVVHTVHIAPFLNVGAVQRTIYLVLEHVAARFTDRFISVSAGMRDAYLRHRIGRPETHHVVHSGMELGKYVRAEAPRAWRERLHWSEPDRPFVVLMLAAFDRRKRHLELVEAAGDLLGPVPEALVCFAGEGHCEAEVRAAADRGGFASRFRFLGHDSRPEELIALADVCVLCSEREGLPRVLVQYVAARKRVVLMRLPGIDELLRDYAGATVVEDGDFGALMAELVRVHDREYLPERRAPSFPPVDLARWENDAMVAGIERVYGAARPTS